MRSKKTEGEKTESAPSGKAINSVWVEIMPCYEVSSRRQSTVRKSIMKNTGSYLLFDKKVV